MSLQLVPAFIKLDADGVTQILHPAEMWRNFTKAVFTRAGVVKPGDFTTTVVPAAMQLTIGAGSAVLPGRETGTTQGMYWAWSDASEVIAWPAAGGSNRMDSLILRVADPQYGTISGNARAYWDAVAGSGASARPDSDFLSGGAKYQPGAWLRIADILVPASATQLTQGNIAFKAGYATTLGFTPSFSTAIPTGLVPGEERIDQDTFAPTSGGAGHTPSVFMWDGSAWVRSRPYRAYQVLSGSAAFVEFTNIPTDLRDVRVRWTARGDTASASTNLSMRINNNTTSNYSYQWGEFTNTSPLANTGVTQTSAFMGQIFANTAGSNRYANGWVDIAGWNDPHNGTLSAVSYDGGFDAAATNAYVYMISHLITFAGPYNAIRLFPAAGNFVTGSQFTLEGI